MQHIAALFLVLTVLAALAPPARAASPLTETTLEKIARTAVLVIGTRTSVLPAVSRKVGKPVKLEKRESTPATRVPLLVTRRVDLIAETMTNAPDRQGDVDFSLTFFVTGGRFLVKNGSPIRGIDDIAGKRVAALERSVDAAPRNLLDSGAYFEIYEKWFGPKGEAPYPMTLEAKEYLPAQLKQ